jgi:hypothetical protein
MKIIYGICYYYNRHLVQNIQTHFECMKKFQTKYPEYSFEMIVNCMMDETNEDIREENIKKLSTLFPITFLHDFNANGTIQGLYNTYLYCKEKKYSNTYIMYFEEDFFPTNVSLLEQSLQLLTPNIIYVGETTTGDLKKTFFRQNVCLKKTSHDFGSELEVWTDGGFYFSSLENFEKIENKIGPFHAGDPTKQYNHAIDGIDLGEVGFPTRLYHTGFSFTYVYRATFFGGHHVE